MKVLIFTHKSDIDGMGGAILASLAFDDVTYVLTETFNLQKEIAQFYGSGSIYDYDMIYVTDLWLEDPTLTKMANDKKFKEKLFVFDHHKSALEDNSNKYSFTTIKVSDDHGLCSGTSLYYEYLISQNLIDRDNLIDDFVELTRRYDTWEWKTIYNDERAHELTLLFESVGCEGYIRLMTEKLANYVKKMYFKEIMGLKAGIIFIDYEYRNDLAEFIRNSGIDIDFVMLIALDYGTISYRNIKEGINVRTIAESLGGKGHDYAASSPINEEKKEQLIRILTRL